MGNISAPTSVCLSKSSKHLQQNLEGAAGKRAGGLGKAGPRKEEQVSPGPNRSSVDREEPPLPNCGSEQMDAPLCPLPGEAEPLIH